MKRVLTPEMEKYFIENAMKESTRQMAAKFGVSKTTVQRAFKINNIIVPKEIIDQFRIIAMSGKTTFTPEEDQYIKDHYLTMPIKTIGQNINRSFTGIMGRIKSLGLELPQELREERKQIGMYRKGQIPANKGKKQSEYLTPEQIEKCRQTSFQKGQIPHNALPDWTEVERHDKRTGRKYILIKVPGIRKLIYKHIWIWENHYKKKLPEGHNIVFRNGNSLDIRINNLECISHSELMQRNTLHNYPPEVKELIHLKGAINRQINKHQKK